MKIGIPREITLGETRVAATPHVVPLLIGRWHEVLVEKNAGAAASFADEQYRQAGARICDDLSTFYADADLILKVQPPRFHPGMNQHEAELLREGSTYIGFLAPLSNLEVIQTFARRRIAGFAMEYIPRIARAQSMDALSSMATVAGYKAVLLAANHLGKMFPLLMTAAGTIPPATVLILGAGVAGLQAIATARRLGAKVEAFDPRPAAKEQISSLGAHLVEMDLPGDIETAGGYAQQMATELLMLEREIIAARLPKADAVITTAHVFGKRAPLLITANMVSQMRPGSVIVDLAAEHGGNCELTEAGRSVTYRGVTIVGAANLPAMLPVDASQMYARNIAHFVAHLFRNNNDRPDFDDKIANETSLTRDGEIVNGAVRSAVCAGGANL